MLSLLIRGKNPFVCRKPANFNWVFALVDRCLNKFLFRLGPFAIGSGKWFSCGFQGRDTKGRPPKLLHIQWGPKGFQGGLTLFFFNGIFHWKRLLVFNLLGQSGGDRDFCQSLVCGQDFMLLKPWTTPRLWDNGEMKKGLHHFLRGFCFSPLVTRE